MELKFDKKEIAAVLIVFLAAFGATQFPAKSTLPGFASAIQLRSALAGHPEPLFIQAAALGERAFSALFRLAPSSPDSTVSFLLLLPPLLLAISALFIYLSIRSLGFGRTGSAFGALLYAFSLSSLSFLPGVYGPGQLAAPLFSLFLLFLCLFAAKRKAELLVPAALFAALAGFISAPFGVAAIAAILAFTASEHVGGGSRLAQFGLLLLASAAGIFLSQGGALYASLASAQSLLVLLPFLIAPGFCTAVLFFSAKETLRDFLLFLFGLVAALFSPVAGGAVLAVAAAAGMERARAQKSSRPLMLLCEFFISFFALAGLMQSVGVDLYSAILAAIMVSFLAPLLLHFYEYRSAQLFSAAGLSLAVLSLFLLAFYSATPPRQFYPQYADPDLSSALSYLAAQGNVAQIAMSGGQDAASFYLPSTQVSNSSSVSSYLASGKPRPASGTYLVLSLSDIDAGQSFGESYSAYRFVVNITNQGSPEALFVSGSGLMALRGISPDGTLSLQDGMLLDQSGSAYSTIPLSGMLLLRPDLPFDSQQNRLIVLDEGSSLTYFMGIYSGKSGELSRVAEFGQAVVFRVL